MKAETDFNPEEWVSWVLEHENEDTSTLALRYAGKKNLPLKALLHQIKGRRIAKQKLPSWYQFPTIFYPDSTIIEQCSSEATALLKATFVKGKKVADLTGGLGVDSWAFAQEAESVIFCEPDPLRCEAARKNFAILGLRNIEVVCNDAESMLQHKSLEGIDLIYLDPSRRSEGGNKVFRLKDLRPDVLSLKDAMLAQSTEVIIKLAPMLDISEGLKQLPETYRVDIISWKGECRELLFHLSNTKNTVEIFCINAGHPEHVFRFSPNEESSLSLTIGEPEKYLFEPDASIRKGGPWRSICEKFGVSLLHPNSHLFTGSMPLENFPGRVFIIHDIMPYKKEIILAALKGHPAQLVFYNFPVDAHEVTKSLGIKSGEPRYLFFTQTAALGTIVLLTTHL
ncbi:MAG: RsmD family RNA methyltransferase [Bacteroidetes bacterium]|nr:RsmD family RNA methyltransferase [Bacteroidota bacterium]